MGYGPGGIVSAHAPGYAAGVRITSYNVCYTKLLRVGVTCTSILWGMGLLMHMSQTGDTERGILILLSCLIMAESCVSLLSSTKRP